MTGQVIIYITLHSNLLKWAWPDLMFLIAKGLSKGLSGCLCVISHSPVVLFLLCPKQNLFLQSWAALIGHTTTIQPPALLSLALALAFCILPNPWHNQFWKTSNIMITKVYYVLISRLLSLFYFLVLESGWLKFEPQIDHSHSTR